jgi:hypothetical protein
MRGHGGVTTDRGQTAGFTTGKLQEYSQYDFRILESG